MYRNIKKSLTVDQVESCMGWAKREYEKPKKTLSTTEYDFIMTLAEEKKQELEMEGEDTARAMTLPHLLARAKQMQLEEENRRKLQEDPQRLQLVKRVSEKE
jgi:hypothetical protein